ncbi:MAG: alpha/beta hydrolase [Actinobacteria bacterium]|nr:alpha/beta hydrolase [Actinomycetota bacterium]
MTRRGRRAGVAGAVVGMVAAGAAAAVAVERVAVGRSRIGGDDDAAEPFGRLPADRTLAVPTVDGVTLHTEVVGGDSAALTVVFVHGYCLDMGTWHFQRRGLAGLREPTVRMVFYDQRGHGRSGSGEPERYTIEQLGRDLDDVIATAAPRGPVVLCGHSMGGMSVMALAEQRPDLFVERVVGVALLSTSAGDMDTVSFGMPRLFSALRRPVMPLLTSGLRSRARWVERARRTGGDVVWLATRRWAFGTRRVRPALVDYVERMNAGTPVETIAGFVATLDEHRRYDALTAFEGIETLVIGGGKDLMTPVEHSRRLAAAISHARFVEVADGAHLMLMDHADEVNEQLRLFLARSGHAARAGREAAERRGA